jgi:thymidylate kinase
MSKIFVCFIGTDGSGKSTLAAHIHSRLQERHKKIKKTYGRYQPLLTKYLMIVGRKLFLNKNNNMFSDYDGYLENKKSLFKKASAISHLFVYLVIIEYCFEMIFKVIIPYKLGYSLICDRYVYDTIINDIMIDMDLSIADATKLLRKFWFFLPRPDMTFLIKVPEEIAIKRKSDIPSLSYLRLRNELYNEIAVSEKCIILDGTAGVSKLEESVMKNINMTR